MTVDKSFLSYKFKKRDEYKEILEFLNSDCCENISIIIKQELMGVDGIFARKRKIKISEVLLENILQSLITKEERDIDLHIEMQSKYKMKEVNKWTEK